MKKQNEILKRAFKEAAENELTALPDENKIIRPYSEDFTGKMDTLLSENSPSKRKKARWVVFIAAAMLTVMLCSVSVFGREFISFFTRGNKETEHFVSYGTELFDEGFDEKTSPAFTVQEGDFTYDNISYDGNKIAFTFLKEGQDVHGDLDYNILLYIDGVRQSFDATYKGESFKDITALHVQPQDFEDTFVNITFQPNIGKKGDELHLSVVMQYDPDFNYYPQCDTENKFLFVGHVDDDDDGICDKCQNNLAEIDAGPNTFDVLTMSGATIKMQADAPTQAEVNADFSGKTVADLHELIYNSYNYEDFEGNKYNDYDDTLANGTVGTAIYKKLEERYYTENGVRCSSNRIKTTPKENDEFTLILFSGSGGKFRVSLYNGTEQLNVFDGKAYTDVEVENGKQVDLKFSLDTTKFPKGDSYVYALYESLDGENREVYKSDVYYIEVE